MHDQQKHNHASEADCVPTLFAFDYPFGIGYCVRVGKYPSRSLERYAVFSLVDAVLILIPRENHAYIQNCSTNRVSGRGSSGSTV